MKKLLGILLTLALILPAFMSPLPAQASVALPQSEILGSPVLNTILGSDNLTANEVISDRSRYSRTYLIDALTNTYTTDFNPMGAPMFTQVGDQWVRYELLEAIDFYQMQGPRLSARFYDDYNEVWNEDLTEVVVYDERWVVEYLNKKGDWVDADFYNTTRSYEVVEDGIKLYRSGDTDIGPRVDTYFWKDEAPVKISIQITPYEAQTVRYIWQQNGIVAAMEAPSTSFNGTAVEGYAWFDSQGERVLVSRWTEELNIIDDVTVVADSHAQGRKADVTFESITVGPGEPAILDPDLFWPDFHIEEKSVDGVVYRTSAGEAWNTMRTGDGNAHDDAGWNSNCGIYRGAGGYTVMLRSVFTYYTADLPDDAFITAASQRLWGTAKLDGMGISPTYNIYEMTSTILVDDLSNWDYNIARWYNTALSDDDLAYVDIINGNWNYWDFNADGFDAISLTWMTYLGMRESTYEAPNVEPGGGIGNTYWQTNTSDGGSTPRLSVTYTVRCTVTTQATTNIEDTTATGSGNITATGGDNADWRGIVYDLGTHGDPGNVHPSASGYSDNQSSAGNFGVGAFTENLVGLTPGKTYYARAWAHNDSGYKYGNEINFLTKPAAPTNVDAHDGLETGNCTITWTKSTGATNYNVGRDGVWLGWVGDVASYADVGATDAYFSDNGTVDASDGHYPYFVELVNNGITVTTTNHVYNLKATNATGDSDNSTPDTGWQGYGAITHQWYRSAADADAGYAILGGVTTNPGYDITAPVNGDGRWYYDYMTAAGLTSGNSTHDRGFRSILYVSTQAVSGFDLFWAIANGIIDDDGGVPAFETGFEYGLTTAYTDNVSQYGTWGTGDNFWYPLTSLTAGSLYHYRAMARAPGLPWVYGQDMVFSTKGSDALYEYWHGPGDGDGTVTHSGNVSCQQFTVGAVSHSVTMVRIPLKKVGIPGDIRVSIYRADGAHKPTGNELAWGIIDDDDLSTSYGQHPVYMTPNDTVQYDEYPLSATLEYAITVRALSGDITNYVLWQWDTGGGLANAESGYSEDTGVTWTMSGGAPDYLFEIWGAPLFDVVEAKVFRDFSKDGDWLIALSYNNVYEPYYDEANVQDYFYIQLIDNTEVIAQVNCMAWGYRPGSIYLNADVVDSLEWGNANYKVRLYGDFGANPYTEYVLVDADWKGDIKHIDGWVRTLATVIQKEDDSVLLTDDPDKGIVLNEAGTAIFLTGIPGLDEVRPQVFVVSVLTSMIETTSWTDALQAATVWVAIVGPEVETIMDDVGNVISVPGNEIAGWIVLMGMVVCVLVATTVGVPAAGFLVSFMLLVGGAYTGAVAFQILGLVTFLGFLFFFAWPKVHPRGRS